MPIVHDTAMKRLLVVLLLAVCSCTPVSKSFEVHTHEVDCAEANQLVYDSVVGMKMEVTAFRPARPGKPGHIRATKTDSRGSMTGDVTITCDETGIHVDPKQTGLGGDKSFERGMFLSFTGRSGLIVDRGEIKGRRRDAAPSAARAGSGDAGAAAARPAGPSPSGSISVKLEPVRGFGTVLDFDADVSAAGILPIKVTVENSSKRAYGFDPRDIAVRVRGSRRTIEPLTPAEAAARVKGAAGGEDIGDVMTAARIIGERKIVARRLAAGDSVSGYLYYELGDYDRARVRMTDIATGEAEGFLVEF